MAGLRVFVSSTCYDLNVLRNQLRQFIAVQGHEPVMSDYNDILYDPRHHTHTNCIDEVGTCDLVVVVIGSRFGGPAIPEAIERVDLDSLETASSSIEVLKRRENISITQLEVLRAAELGVPIFVFIEDRVWHDHATYEKNKGKSIIDSIEFSSIEKPKTAKYIFEFINFLRHRTQNNAVSAFSKYSDLEESLRQQWSAFFKRLLNEQRQRNAETRRIDALAEQFEDLKAAMLSTISDDVRRKVARGVVQFRRLYDFLASIETYIGAVSQFGRDDSWNWSKILEKLDVHEVTDFPRDLWRSLASPVSGPRVTAVFVKIDGTVYVLHFPLTSSAIQEDLAAFMNLTRDNREIILEALEEGSSRRGLTYTGKTLDDFLNSIKSDAKSDLPPEAPPINKLFGLLGG
ncbi:MAG: DUF4062 domain-containing protein [Rubrivivax sp.]|nr:MAG: DUF4062 domain-containing protein [Rubrivivax sp.]